MATKAITQDYEEWYDKSYKLNYPSESYIEPEDERLEKIAREFLKVKSGAINPLYKKSSAFYEKGKYEKCFLSMKKISDLFLKYFHNLGRYQYDLFQEPFFQTELIIPHWKFNFELLHAFELAGGQYHKEQLIDHYQKTIYQTTGEEWPKEMFRTVNRERIETAIVAMFELGRIYYTLKNYSSARECFTTLVNFCESEAPFDAKRRLGIFNIKLDNLHVLWKKAIQMIPQCMMNNASRKNNPNFPSKQRRKMRFVLNSKMVKSLVRKSFLQ